MGQDTWLYECCKLGPGVICYIDFFMMNNGNFKLYMEFLLLKRKLFYRLNTTFDKMTAGSYLLRYDPSAEKKIVIELLFSQFIKVSCG